MEVVGSSSLGKNSSYKGKLGRKIQDNLGFGLYQTVPGRVSCVSSPLTVQEEIYPQNES